MTRWVSTAAIALLATALLANLVAFHGAAGQDVTTDRVVGFMGSQSSSQVLFQGKVGLYTCAWEHPAVTTGVPGRITLRGCVPLPAQDWQGRAKP